MNINIAFSNLVNRKIENQQLCSSAYPNKPWRRKESFGKKGWYYAESFPSKEHFLFAIYASLIQTFVPFKHGYQYNIPIDCMQLVLGLFQMVSSWFFAVD